MRWILASSLVLSLASSSLAQTPWTGAAGNVVTGSEFFLSGANSLDREMHHRAHLRHGPGEARMRVVRPEPFSVGP